MQVFRPAPERTAAHNLAVTLAQTSVFWLAFIVVGPWVLAEIERSLALPTFPVQQGFGLVVAAAMGVLNLWSGWTMAVIGRGTPFPTQTARELVVRGPYRFVRNPMALGGLGVAAGVGLARGSAVTLLYAVAGGVLWHLVARPMEERDLAARFGPPYERYRAAVRCWWPGRPYPS
jgi:protein-S-isoprenylcysteine O-methyltransferase Ste14